MKNSLRVLLSLAIVAIVLMGSFSVKAQEEESESPFDAGLDIYSSYIWRGAKFGSGPAFQPWVSAAFGGLEIGAWGSVSASFDESLEMDLYVSYSIGDLSIGVTSYYFGIEDELDTLELPTGETFGWLDFDKTHSIEPMISYSVGDFSLTAAYMFAPDFEEGDMYFEAGYSIKGLDIALGAGDGQYTAHVDDGELKDDFGICNISLGTSKEIKITEDYALPLSGAVVLNPTTGGFFITAGVSF